MNRASTVVAALFLIGCTDATGQALPVVEEQVFHSTSLGEDRELLVSVPASYDGGTARYPVLYVLDGRSNLLHTIASARHLAANGRIPEMIVVGVPNVRREYDMTPADLPLPTLGGEGGRADAFLRFLRDEVGDWVSQRYRASRFSVLLGHSHGGLFAAHAFSEDPDAFTAYVLMDAPLRLHDGTPAKRMIETASRSGPAHVVSVKRGLGFTDEEVAAFEAAAATEVRFTHIDFAERGESHASMVMPATYEGLAAAFADFPQRTVSPKTAETVLAEFADATGAYGRELQPSLYHLTENAEAHLMLRQGRTARELIDLARDLYGPSLALERMLERAEDVGDGDGLVAVEMEQGGSTSASDFEPYFGTWEGRMHHEGGIPEYFLLTFFADGDEVAATIATSRPGRKDYREAEALAFVRLREGRIEFGSPNLRMPGGTWIYSVEPRSEDEMLGTKEIKDVLLPADIVVPEMVVTLRRR